MKRLFALALVSLAIPVGLAWAALDDIKYFAPVRHAYYWYFNLRHAPANPKELGDGGAKEQVLFGDPVGLEEDRDGNVYVSDRGRSKQGRVIWKLDGQGNAQVIAGTGLRGGAPADVLALASDLGAPEGLCLDRAGRLYFADAYNHVVLRLESDGRLSRIAGTGKPGYNGDLMPATESLLNNPYDCAIDSQGNLYIADTHNQRIRKVTPQGTITTVAGTGETGYDAAATTATQASLGRPFGLAVDPEDHLYIADSENHVIRRVDADGTIATVAGTGEPGYAGDGGPANLARLDTPQDIAFLSGGLMIVNDEHNHALRIIDHKGQIATLVGNGTPGLAGEDEQARTAQLHDPEHVLVRSDGSLLVTEGDNHRVLILGPDMHVRSFAGRGIGSRSERN